MRINKTIRIFISSTFEDMILERDLLQSRVIPYLKTYCEASGWYFEAIDLRWGINEEASTHQKTMSICLDELQRCKEISPKPNFLVLLGQRYGWCPLPETIAGGYYEDILNIADKEEIMLFDEWYKQDKNDLKNEEYILQARTGKYSEYAVYEVEVYTPLNALFRRFAKELPHQERVIFTSSATEQEIIKGLEGDPNHVVCFKRSLTDIPNELQEKYLSTEAHKEQLTELNTKLTERILDENLITKEISYNKYQSSQYSEEYSEAIKTTIKKIIDDEFVAYEQILCEERESTNHRLWREEKITHFSGREEETKNIMEAVKNLHVPIWIQGASGCGKSTLVANTAKLCSKNRYVYERYIGCTIESSNGYNLLSGLIKCLEIDFPNEDKYVIPTEIMELAKLFMSRIESLKNREQIAIFIDGVDQLNEQDKILLINSIPKKLPPNIAFVVSSTLEVDVPKQCYTIKVDGLKYNESISLITKWLESEHRRLTKEQWKYIEEVVSKGTVMPAYLFQLFNIVKQWHSYDSPKKLPADQHSLIKYRIEELSLPQNHGALLVDKVLGLISVSKHGLSHDEILESLAIDEEFFGFLIENSKYELQAVSQARRSIPPIFLSRLIYDMKSFIITKDTIGGTVYNFYHQTIRTVIQDEVLKDAGAKFNYQETLINYFDSRWEEPYTRALEELPYLLVGAKMKEKLEKLLSKLKFIQHKCAIGLTHSLQIDYQDATKVCDSLQLEEYHNFLIANGWLLDAYTSKYDYFTAQVAQNYRSKEIRSQAKKILASAYIPLCLASQSKTSDSKERILFSQSRFYGDISKGYFINNDQMLMVYGLNHAYVLTIPYGNMIGSFSQDQYIYRVSADAKGELIVFGKGCHNKSLVARQKFILENGMANFEEYMKRNTIKISDYFVDNIALWNPESNIVRYLTHPGAYDVSEIAISPDGNYLISYTEEFIVWKKEEEDFVIDKNTDLSALNSNYIQIKLSANAKFILLEVYGDIYSIYNIAKKEIIINDLKSWLKQQMYDFDFTDIWFDNIDQKLILRSATNSININLENLSVTENREIVPIGKIQKSDYLLSETGKYLLTIEKGTASVFIVDGDQEAGDERDSTQEEHHSHWLVDNTIERAKEYERYYFPMPNGGYLKETYNGVEVYNPQTGKEGKIMISCQEAIDVKERGILSITDSSLILIDNDLELQLICNSAESFISCALFPDNIHYLLSRRDGSIFIGDLNSIVEYTPIKYLHNERINHMVISPNGRYIATVSNDRFIIVWDSQTWNELYRFYSPKQFTRLYWDCEWVVAANHNEDFIVWKNNLPNFGLTQK